jgi:hypothetical protein
MSIYNNWFVVQLLRILKRSATSFNRVGWIPFSGSSYPIAFVGDAGCKAAKRPKTLSVPSEIILLEYDRPFSTMRNDSIPSFVRSSLGFGFSVIVICLIFVICYLIFL